MLSAPRFRAVVELGLAGVAAVGCALSWSQVRSTVLIAPLADGEPATTSASYQPQQLALVLLLAAVAGVLAVLGAARMYRSRPRRRSAL